MSVTFESKHYYDLQRIAESKRVSMAWVIREAVIEYLVTSNNEVETEHNKQVVKLKANTKNG